MNYERFSDFESNQLAELCGLAEKNSYINPQLFSKYEVKRGCAISAAGGLAGLTEIGEVYSYSLMKTKWSPFPGSYFKRTKTMDRHFAHFGFKM